MDVITNNVLPVRAKDWDLFSCVGTFFSIVRIALFLSFIPDNFSIYQYSLSYLKNHNAIQIKADIKCNILENNSFLSFSLRIFFLLIDVRGNSRAKFKFVKDSIPWKIHLKRPSESTLRRILGKLFHPHCTCKTLFVRGLDTCYCRFRPPDIHGTVCLLCIMY